ncbi:MAG: NrsF family protein [Pseudomonadota bacterium]
MSNDKKDIDDLIKGLCDNLEPVKACCPYRQISVWAIFSILYIVGVVMYSGVAIDLSDYMSRASFMFEMGLVIAMFVTSALASSFLNFPDSVQRDWMKIIATTLFSVFILWIVANGMEEAIREGYDFSSAFLLPSCSRGLIVEIVPFLALVFLGARGHTTQPYWSMAMNIIAVSAIGWIGLRISCQMYDNMTYGFLHYLLPFCILGAAIGFFSRRIFKW